MNCLPLRLLTAALLMIFACAGTAAAEPGFEKWLGNFRPVAEKAGVSRATFKAAFAGITAPDVETVEKMGRQAEFTKKVWEYLDSAVSETQVKNGTAMQKKFAAQLANIEKRYGVDKQVVLAVWGIETRYGAKMGDHNVIHALATLAYAAPRRNDFWTQRADHRAEDRAGGPCRAERHDRLVGRRHGPHAVHADDL